MNIDKIRQDIKGLSDNKIFLNNAGSSLMPNIVVDSMIDYLHQEAQTGGYDTADKNSTVLESFYAETAELINCKPRNIAFMTSATEAFAKALSSIIFKDGDVIITTVDDYISNQITFISLQKNLNVKIIRIENTSDNELDLENLVSLIKKYNPKLVAVTHIPTNSGLIQNVVGVGKICRQYDILYLVDACQSVGQMPIDAEKIGCDFLTATGRKFMRGPRGSGFLFVSDRVLDKNYAPLLLDMRGAHWSEYNDYKLFPNAKLFEHWESSYASIRGFIEAVTYAKNIGLKNIEDYNKKLSEKLRQNLQDGGYKTWDWGKNLSSIITFSEPNGNLENIQKVLIDNNIFFSVTYKNSALIDFTNKILMVL